MAPTLDTRSQPTQSATQQNPASAPAAQPETNPLLQSDASPSAFKRPYEPSRWELSQKLNHPKAGVSGAGDASSALVDPAPASRFELYRSPQTQLELRNLPRSKAAVWPESGFKAAAPSNSPASAPDTKAEGSPPLQGEPSPSAVKSPLKMDRWELSQKLNHPKAGASGAGDASPSLVDPAPTPRLEFEWTPGGLRILPEGLRILPRNKAAVWPGAENKASALSLGQETSPALTRVIEQMTVRSLDRLLDSEPHANFKWAGRDSDANPIELDIAIDRRPPTAELGYSVKLTADNGISGVYNFMRTGEQRSSFITDRDGNQLPENRLPPPLTIFHMLGESDRVSPTK